MSRSPYATTTRPEIHQLLPVRAQRFLDVGCNDGGFAAWLADGNPDREVWAIEPNLAQALKAQEILTGQVVAGSFPEAMNDIPGNFDCIIFNHVLEHMLDPWSALEVAKERTTEDGCIIAVIPNIRYAPVVADLAFRGRWEYVDAGVLDRTHLRFFTRRSILELFGTAGLEVNEIRPVNAIAQVRAPRVSKAIASVAPNFVHSAYAVRAS